MSQRAIYQRDPQNQEETIRLEADALGDGAADERGRDDREHSLKENVQVDRNVGAGQWIGGLIPLEKNQFFAEAKEADVVPFQQGLAKCQGIADGDPIHSHDGEATMLCIMVARMFLRRTMPP